MILGTFPHVRGDIFLQPKPQGPVLLYRRTLVPIVPKDLLAPLLDSKAVFIAFAALAKVEVKRDLNVANLAQH